MLSSTVPEDQCDIASWPYLKLLFSDRNAPKQLGLHHHKPGPDVGHLNGYVLDCHCGGVWGEKGPSMALLIALLDIKYLIRDFVFLFVSFFCGRVIETTALFVDPFHSNHHSVLVHCQKLVVALISVSRCRQYQQRV